MSLKLAARAKINWSLAITGERTDGYHELEMLMQRIDLADELIFERAQVLEPEHRRPAPAHGRAKSYTQGGGCALRGDRQAAGRAHSPEKAHSIPRRDWAAGAPTAPPRCWV